MILLKYQSIIFIKSKMHLSIIVTEILTIITIFKKKKKSLKQIINFIEKYVFYLNHSKS